MLMLKKSLVLLSIFAVQLFIAKVNAQIVGQYTGIDYATNYTNPSQGSSCPGIAAVNAAIGDADFVNGAAEIELGWSFAGTWNSGATYTDGPGSELLLVSLHTYTETWSVALLLSNGTTTAFSTYALTIVTTNASGTLQACNGFYAGPYNYERPSQELDFASYAIPPGVGVIGIVFEPLTDGAANPDPHGVLVLQNTPILTPGSTITTDSTCFNSCNGGATVIDGPDVPYTYQWDAAAGNATTQSVSNLCPGSYTVYAYGFTGTIDTLIANVGEFPQVTLNEVSSMLNVCYGDDGQIEVSGSGGAVPYQYSINSSPFGTSGIFDPLAPGNYTIIVQDGNLCEDTLTRTIVEGTEIVVTESVTDEICIGDCQGTISLNATGDGPMNYSINNCSTTFASGNFADLCPGNYSPTTYSWNNGAQGANIQISEAGTYIVTLSNLCHTSIDSMHLETKFCDIETPNILSLAQGSQNSLWYVHAEGLGSFNVIITNRYGNVVYECSDMNAKCYWDGRDKSGLFVTEGTYFYTIDATLEGGEALQKQGFIQVVD